MPFYSFPRLSFPGLYCLQMFNQAFAGHAGTSARALLREKIPNKLVMNMAS
jgi:hypothetical protein